MGNCSAGILSGKQRREDYLNNKVFAGQEGEEVQPDERDVQGFDEFMVRYKDGLAIERAAVEHLK